MGKRCKVMTEREKSRSVSFTYTHGRIDRRKVAQWVKAFPGAIKGDRYDCLARRK